MLMEVLCGPDLSRSLMTGGYVIVDAKKSEGSGRELGQK
jgi:hypothetical protein